VALPLVLRLLCIPLAHAIPSHYHRLAWVVSSKHPAAVDEDGGGGWLYLVFAGILVLLGGAFAGLTIA